MKNQYTVEIDKYNKATVDLVKYSIGKKSMLITKIEVPREFQDEGIGSELLRLVLEDADRTFTTLWLEIHPKMDTTAEMLHYWYTKFGFVKMESGMYRRRANKDIPEVKNTIGIL